MEINDWTAWLEQTKLATAMREDLWLYPIVEIVHITGIAILVGTAVMFDMRLLGFSKDISIVKLANHLLTWSRRSLLLVVPSGLLLFMANAEPLARDPVFLLKLGLISLAGVNALYFHYTIFRTVTTWDIHQPTPAVAKVNAVASIVLWIAVICCGRLLAY